MSFTSEKKILSTTTAYTTPLYIQPVTKSFSEFKMNNNLEDFFDKEILSDDAKIKKINAYNALFFNNENWKRLDYSHWLNLFSYYNISLYDRLVKFKIVF